MILPAQAIIDGAALLADIAAELASLPAPDPRAARAVASRLMGQARTEANARLEAAFAAHPRAASQLIRAQAHLTDVLVTVAHRVAMEQQVAGQTQAIQYEDAEGNWHEELARGDDRPEADVVE